MFRPASTIIVALKWNIWNSTNSSASSAPFRMSNKVQPPKNYDYRIMMVKRSDSIRFFPSAHVFPGGVVDKDDHDHRWFSFYGLHNHNNNVNSKNLPIKVAGMREVFEETNFFVDKNQEIFDRYSIDKLESVKQATLKDGSLKLLDFFESTNIKPSLDHLKQWARWITPEGEAKYRYDTYFYLVPLYEYPTTCQVDQTENVLLDWLSPDEALEEHNQGKIFLPPPTWVTILQMSRCKTLEELLEMSKKREQLDVLYEAQNLFQDSTQSELPGGEPCIISVLPGDVKYNTKDGQPKGEYLRRILIRSRTGNLKDKCSWYYKYQNTTLNPMENIFNGVECKINQTQSKL
eukprot:gene5954-7415_t